MSAKPAIRSSTKPRRGERGYILITLVFMFAILVIMFTIIAPSLIFEAKRDREEEMIHRGVQYARSIRAFVKKNSRYPTRLEELDNTNQIRFLRRHYKDPITGKDFKLLHQGDVPSLAAGGLAGGIPAAGLNGVQGAQAAQQQAAAQIVQGLAAGQSGLGNSGFGSSGFGGLNASSNPSATDASSGDAGQQSQQSQNTSQNGQSDSGSSGGNSGGTASAGGQPGQNGQPGTAGQPGQNQNGNAPGQVFGGGPIVGVASTSKDKTIRIFNKKTHYNDWQFIYNPATDRGGLINTPAQPAFQAQTTNPQTPGQNNSQNGSGTGGTFNGFGGPTNNGGTNNGNQNPTEPQAPGQLPEQ